MGQPCRKLKIGVSRVGGRGWLQLCSSSFTPSHLTCAGLWGGGGGGDGGVVGGCIQSGLETLMRVE